MSHYPDITGQRFGRLVVIERAGMQRAHRLWLCQCDCGATAEVTTGNLRKAKGTRSCGCLKFDVKRTHGATVNGHETPAYRSWRGMHDRCERQNHVSYQWYGAKGVKVCARWQSFENFLADMGERPAGLTIDRIDSSKDYEPGNCRWATPSEQTKASRKNRRP